MAAKKCSTKPLKEQLFKAQLGVNNLEALFAHIKEQTGVLLESIDPSCEFAVVALEALAEKGAREANQVAGMIMKISETEARPSRKGSRMGKVIRSEA